MITSFSVAFFQKATGVQGQSPCKKTVPMLRTGTVFEYLFKLKCTCVQLVVMSLLGNQLLMAATLNDPAVVKHHDHI